MAVENLNQPPHRGRLSLWRPPVTQHLGRAAFVVPPGHRHLLYSPWLTPPWGQTASLCRGHRDAPWTSSHSLAWACPPPRVSLFRPTALVRGADAVPLLGLRNTRSVPGASGGGHPRGYKPQDEGRDSRHQSGRANVSRVKVSVGPCACFCHSLPCCFGGRWGLFRRCLSWRGTGRVSLKRNCHAQVFSRDGQTHVTVKPSLGLAPH